MNPITAFLVSFFSGYTFSLYFTHPEKKKHVVPKIKFKNIEILPSLKIHFRNTTYHIHHWFIFALITISSFFVLEGLFTYLFMKGVLLGCTVQGLRYKDRFSFRNPRYQDK